MHGSTELNARKHGIEYSGILAPHNMNSYIDFFINGLWEIGPLSQRAQLNHPNNINSFD